MRSLIRSLALHLALAAALLALVPGLAASALAQAGARVASIEFKGNRRYDADTLRLSIRTKRGTPLDESALNEDVKTLYEFFSSVQVVKEQKGDEVSITFVVAENELVTDVLLGGVSGIAESDVRAVIDTTRGRPLADYRVANDARKIERLYRMKGYHFVEVRTETADSGDGKAVTFDVLEGPKVQVDKITFVGNEHIARSKLLDWMATQETGFLGLRGADYVAETLQKDRGSLTNYYRREGYLDAVVQVQSEEFSQDRRRVSITIAVTEGPAFTIGNVSITGAERYPGGEQALRQFLAVESGRRFRNDDVIRTQTSIESAYHDEGFFSVDVRTEERAVGTTVDLAIQVDEQSRVRVRNLVIVGNEITQDKVIRREISVYPGNVLNQNEIQKSQDRLDALGYFTGHVQADVVRLPEGDDPYQRDVRFEVDDTAKTGQVRFAVGASSDLGLLGSFTITKHNFDWRDWPEHFGDVFSGRAFTGAGQTFQLEVSPGTTYSNYQLAFTEPWMFDKPISFGWDLFLSKFSRFDYDVDRKGLDLTLGRRFTFEGRKVDTVLSVSGTTRIESVDLNNVSSRSAPTAFLAQGRNTLLSERFTFRIDRADNPGNPTDGWYAQWRPEFGFAGDVRLVKNELEARRYFTLWTTEDERKHTLTLGSRAGLVSAQGGSVEADPNLFGQSFVPTFERFFAGGTMDYQIRGFAFGGAGPHGRGSPFLSRAPGENPRRRNVRLAETAQKVIDNDGDPLGGDVAFVANAEWGFPLYQDVLGGVVFLDTGLVRDSSSSTHGLDRGEFDKLVSTLRRGGKRQRQLARQLRFDDGPSFVQDIRASWGFGFRIRIPGLGRTPIALDFGFPFRRQTGDDTQVLSFSIAQNF